jgi:hypothetical protein
MGFKLATEAAALIGALTSYDATPLWFAFLISASGQNYIRVDSPTDALSYNRPRCGSGSESASARH